MAPNLSEEEVDDILYLARTGDTEDFHTYSHEICKREKCDLLQLLQTAQDVESGNTVLHMAAANGHDSFLTVLFETLSITAVVPLLNKQNKSGNTPLHWSALNGHLECVKALIEKGADPTVKNAVGHDPVYEAELADRKEVVEWVLKEGGDGLEAGMGVEGRKDEEEVIDGEGTTVVEGTEGEEGVTEGVERLGLGAEEEGS